MRHTARFDPAVWKRTLANRQRRVLDNAGVKPSAVLMPLFWRHDTLHILFTKRSDHVTTHKGQISFPGGRKDPEDADLQATALRECSEEIGLPPGHIDVLGALDDIFTLGTVRITPYLGLIEDGFAYVTNPAEVAAMLEVPVGHFLDPARQRIELYPTEHGTRKVYFYDIEGGEVVWGATARIVTDWLKLVAETQGCSPEALSGYFGG
jgi:8-oxo-dGTP pyrophosphatase MutT (NUDIX family)